MSAPAVDVTVVPTARDALAQVHAGPETMAARSGMTAEQRRALVDVLLIAGGVLIGLLGFYSSFGAVVDTMRPSFGPKAWIVPLGVDVGIAVLTAWDLRMASKGERTWWLRFIPHGLSVATIYLNVAGETSMEGRVGHGVMVGLWVVFVAAVAHKVKLRAIPVGGRPRRDRIPPGRWLLAPISTARILRGMVCHEIRSYDRALALWDTRGDAIVDLQDNHGGLLRWRWKAPRRDRLQVRRWAKASTPARKPAATQSPSSSAPRSKRRSQPNGSDRPRSRGAGGDRRQVSDDELDALGRRLVAEGVPATHRALLDALRAEGIAVGSDRVTKLLARLHDREGDR